MRLLFLLTLTLWSAVSEAAPGDCPISNVTCDCDPTGGGYEIWCPRRVDHKLHLHYKPGQLAVTCNSLYRLTPAEILAEVEGAVVGRLESLLMNQCPLFGESYSGLILRALKIRDLRKLVIDHATSEDGLIVEGQFDGIPSLRLINLHGDNVVSVHPRAFKGLPKLASLKLNLPSLTDLAPDDENSFADDLADLIEFELILPKLRNLTSGKNLLRGQTSLQSFRFSARKLKSLPRDLLRNLTALTSVRFEPVYLTGDGDNFPPDFFVDNPNLRNFTFQGRGFQSAAESIFRGTKLERFQWNIFACPRCEFNFTNNFLSEAADLRFVHVSSKKIGRRISAKVALFPGFFRGCSSLEEVTFKGLGLASLPEDLFASAKHRLKVIEIVENDKLRNLPEEIFRDLTKLRTLDLTANSLSRISDSHFDALRSLTWLGLKGNKIGRIERRAFGHLSQLRNLDLSLNGELDFGAEDVDWNALTRLEHLDLSGNNISLTSRDVGLSSFPQAWASILLKLRSLDLSRNNLGPVLNGKSMFFQQMSDVLKVDLRFNAVKMVNFSGFHVIDKFNKNNNDELTTSSARPPQLKKAQVYLADNPLQCDCEILPLFKLSNGDLKGKLIDEWFAFVDADEAVCAGGPQSPPGVKGRIFSDLNYEDIQCELGQSCPDNCNCLFAPEDNENEASVVKVVCSDVTQMPNVSISALLRSTTRWRFIMLPNSRTFLDLSKSNLSESSSSGFNLPEGVEEISMSNTGLERFRLDRDSLPTHLKRLNLTRNRLTSLDAMTLKLFSGLDEVALGHNPYACTCDILPLQNFVKLNYRRIVDWKNISVLCGSGNEQESRPILKWNESDLCTDVVEITSLIAVGVLIGLLGVAILVLWYKRHIKIYLYSRSACRRFFVNEEGDDDRPYDAFISYCEDDSDFVLEQLVPQLETGDPELKYRCVFRERFMPGVNYQEQVLTAVNSSKRSLIILSKSMVKSATYQQELLAAQSKKRVVVVALDGLPSKEEMGPVMWNYVKTKSFLNARHKHFYDKLRFQLPHRGGRSRRSVMREAGSRRRTVTDEMRLIGLVNNGSNGHANPNFED